MTGKHVYVIDEKGLENLRNDFGNIYDIYTVLIKRKPSLRRHVGVSNLRISRDGRRKLIDSDYDYVIENNSTKKVFFEQIEKIYDEIKQKGLDDGITEREGKRGNMYGL